ncbi:MAG: hypothetical protein Ta2D_01580 [Rickettsiales bacterium]|nr:MAG: hypothetical protein Ta2D_01580 [Rickettsiales bacterium]
MDTFLLCLGIFFIYQLIKSFGLKDDFDIKNEDLLRQQAISNFLKETNDVKPKEIKVLEAAKPVEKKKIFDFEVSDKEEEALKKIYFEKEEFLTGVDDAIDIVSDFLSKKEFDNLKSILSKELFDQFKARADDFEKQEKNLQSQVIQVLSKKIDSLKIEKDKLYIVVAVESEQINYIEDKNKNIILGSKKEKSIIKEKWVFKTDIKKECLWVIDNVI